VIVDTNNPAELPAGHQRRRSSAIIDHHKLVGGLETKGPIDITIRPLACTATIMQDLMGDDGLARPRAASRARCCRASCPTRWNSAAPPPRP
jgi:manganese-dependent inorganic pyrophosphatase